MEAFKVGLAEFQANFEEFLVAGNPVAITYRGNTIAHFIPTAGPDGALLTALIEPGGKRDRRRAPRAKGADAIAAEFAAAQKRSK
jgi:antitoxin (DNA-binding transcriptional repressor) of toxin-antitoxin stability system